MSLRLLTLLVAAVPIGFASNAWSLSDAPRRVGADLAAVRVAVRSSGIFVPFRPARLGVRGCRIPRGGPSVKVLPGTCVTRVVRRTRERVVILSESWDARDFRGSGARFLKPSGHRLKTTWRVAVTPAGEIRDVRIFGNFPPQLVL
jgi:hypothetical protein